MKINNVLRMFFAALFLTFAVTSCEDDYSEEELLRQQNELAAQQRAAEQAAEDAAAEGEATNLTEQQQENLAALNLAGELLDFSVTVTADNGPVANATIMATNVKGETATATTDENGNVTLQDVSMGGHTITMKSDEVVDLSFEIDFGSPIEDINYEIIDGVVYPIETSESATITGFSLSGVTTSKVKGVVTVETDVTNKEVEIPQDLTVQAVFSSYDANTLVSVSSTTGEEEVQTYAAKTVSNVKLVDSEFGKAKVDPTTGEYEMTLPVVRGVQSSTNVSYDFDIIIPDFEADAKVAYTNEDGDVVVGSFPAVFGPSRDGLNSSVYGSNSLTSDNNFDAGSNTTNYTNLKAVFSEPAPEGEGLTFEYTPEERTLDVDGTLNLITTSEDPEEYVSTDASTKIVVTRGSGYTSQPDVTITDGGQAAGETEATAVAIMEYKFTDATVVDGGAGFSPGDVLTFNIERLDTDGVTIAASGSGAVQNASSIDFVVDEVSSNVITAISFDNSSDKDTFGEIANLGSITLTFDSASDSDGSITVDAADEPELELVYEGRMEELDITNVGSGFTQAPQINIDGNATATVELAFQYNVAPAGVGTPYVYAPTAIEFEGELLDGTTNVETGNVSDGNTLLSKLEVDEDGDIVFEVASDKSYLIAKDGSTDAYFADVPEATVTNVEHVQAKAKIAINSVQGGTFSGFTAQNGNPFSNDLAVNDNNTDRGLGYTTAPTVTFQDLEGNPVTDVEVTLETTKTGRAIEWNGNYTIDEEGSGIEGDLNNENIVPSNLDISGNNLETITPEEGKLFIRDLNYGRGFLKDATIQ